MPFQALKCDVMNRNYLIAGCLVVLVAFKSFSQPAEPRISKEEYIEIYKEDAVKEMLFSGVPASITLAQAMLESDFGNSPLARYANNHFGIKCHKGWTGGTFYQDDDARNECFRKYYTVYKSYRDHSEFLSNRKRYASLFLLKRTDYKSWAKGLKKAGYATNPQYANLLIKIIEENVLYNYDKVRKMPVLAYNELANNQVKMLNKKRAIKFHDNNIKYLIARHGDTYYKIAKEFDMGLWQIKKYNDLNKGDELTAGDIIYLQPKRGKAKVKFHVVKKGETMREISQRYGIKLKALYKKNNMIIGTQPRKRQKLYMRKSKVE